MRKALLLSAPFALALAYSAGAVAQTPPKPPGAIAAPGAVSIANITTLNANGRAVDLRTANPGEVLKGASGRTITVQRVRDLQAKIASAPKPPAPLVAKPGQKLATLTSAPAGTRILLPNGRSVSKEQLSKLQSIRAKLDQKRTPKPIPLPTTAPAQATIGQNGFTMADALKRPGNEVIQVGSRRYTADALRSIDQQLRASPAEPKGLLDRTGRGAGTASAPAAAGPRLKVARGAKLSDVLSKPDNTVVETPSGKTATVGQIKQYMARENLTAAQLEAKFAGAKVVETKGRP
jgi:hypothetical protein